MEPYRDAGPGIEARLEELRASWARQTDDALSSWSASLARHAGRLAAGQTLVGMLAMLGVVVSLVPRWIVPLELALLPYVVWLLADHAHAAGARRTIEQVKRELTRRPADPHRELEQLANQTPGLLVAAQADLLAARARRWSLAGNGLVLVVGPLLVATQAGSPGALADAALIGAFPLALLVLALAATSARRSRLLGMSLAAAAPAVIGVSTLFGPGALLVTLLQTALLVHGLTRR